ncbi:glycosyltransferase family 4 protein [Sphingomonas sp. LY160]|uniref:glycosyltransferase family 4 protein n=1 Tax=Sphingomonas sp. LY160 TaxID=3095342 RepID=UPI002ADEB666|nr:glycosyltransferase family 4 protein [Sphingomonas sp. LY160]MEA1071025.1 glycosyltransferase family 4 protein [Sphingomonas sp. LY160]
MAFTKYDREAASTRQRVLQYLPSLADAGIHVDYRPLLGDDYVRSLATGEGAAKGPIARSYLRRFRQLIEARQYDVLWVYAELFPLLPSAFEKLIFATGRPVVYDMDDAFFEAFAHHPSRARRRLLTGKLDGLMAGAAACCCGNEYLRSYASQFCNNSILLPTVVDTSLYVPAPRDDSQPLTIGWIGSPSTWPMVRPLLPLLKDLVERHSVRVRVVGAGAGASADGFDVLDFVQWSEEREIADVQSMDIGIMPLIDGPFERGKSGYKLIQYMACGLPVVGSPVGVNSSIVREGINGFLATDLSQWRAALERLIADADLRQGMGRVGRDIAVEEYSLASQAPRLVDVFRSVMER